MSTEVASALIGAAAALTVVVANGIAQRWLGARRQRDELAAAAITDVFVALTLSAHGSQRESSELFTQAKVRIAAYGSRKVVDALLAFQRAGNNTMSPEGRAAFADLVRCARTALGNRNNVSREDVLRVLFDSSDER
ncbi:MAG TPA: hypothetical protein VN845_08975 [Solirubrobacteraceae bacterium]|nr:hypothetical protein [Solirubrobacteraceae bacterium]